MNGICKIQSNLKVFFIGFSYWFLFGCGPVIFTTPIPRYRPSRYRSFSLPSLEFFALKDTRYRPFFVTKTSQKYQPEAFLSKNNR